MEYSDEKILSKHLIFLFLSGLFIFLITKKKVPFKRAFDSRLKFQNIFIVSNNPKLNKFNDIINFENVDEVFKFFNMIDLRRDVHVIILTEGGESDGADSIAYNLSNLKGNGYNHKVNIYVPCYAYSSGSMMMLAGDNIYMNWYSLASPVDSQLEYELDDNETFSVKHLRKMKIDGEYKNSIASLIKKDAEAIYQTDLYILNKVLRKNSNKKKIIDNMFHTNLSHGTNYNIKDLKKMGLNIITPVPEKFQLICEKLLYYL